MCISIIYVRYILLTISQIRCYSFLTTIVFIKTKIDLIFVSNKSVSIKFYVVLEQFRIAFCIILLYSYLFIFHMYKLYTYIR